MKRLHLQEPRLPITLKDRILKLGSLSACPGGISPSSFIVIAQRERGGDHFVVLSEKEMLAGLPESLIYEGVAL